MAISAIRDNDLETAQQVIGIKSDISLMMDSAATHQALRLVADEPGRLEAYTLEIDVIEKLKRIYYFAKRMAKTLAPEEAEEHAE